MKPTEVFDTPIEDKSATSSLVCTTRTYTCFRNLAWRAALHVGVSHDLSDPMHATQIVIYLAFISV